MIWINMASISRMAIAFVIPAFVSAAAIGWTFLRSTTDTHQQIRGHPQIRFRLR